MFPVALLVVALPAVHRARGVVRLVRRGRHGGGPGGLAGQQPAGRGGRRAARRDVLQGHLTAAARRSGSSVKAPLLIGNGVTATSKDHRRPPGGGGARDEAAVPDARPGRANGPRARLRQAQRRIRRTRARATIEFMAMVPLVLPCWSRAPGDGHGLRRPRRLPGGPRRRPGLLARPVAPAAAAGQPAGRGRAGVGVDLRSRPRRHGHGRRPRPMVVRHRRTITRSVTMP